MLVVFFFLGLGLVQVYSSSYIFAMEKHGDGLLIFRRQLVFTGLAVLALLGGTYMPFKWLRIGTPLLWVVAVVGLILTFVPELAIKAGGAQRWVKLPFGQRFEPGEMIKLVLPLVMATYLSRPDQRLSGGQWFFRFVFLGLPLLLVLRQPDFGTFAICVSVCFLMLFAFGLRWRYILGGLAFALPAFYFLVVNVPYRAARMKAFLDPWSDPAQKGFQVIQSMLAFSAGGVWGAGLGQGQGKLFFLPEAHTDFTLAVLGEETGYVGFLLVLLLYGVLVFRGFQISVKASDLYARAAALGLTVVFGLGVFINVGVVLGFLPTKGLTLPFLSYGGSSLVMTCLGFGWLLNIDRQNKQTRPKRGAARI
ncbi:MAG: cell division protein FtsW [Bdellovibrionaceae bacterium]|nr:cell division protein FtsW [Bdellovibrionales bacterium]MCB9084784.1 cell division protein FtsW [Pseudobdellovibrionaceae bacterium]